MLQDMCSLHQETTRHEVTGITVKTQDFSTKITADMNITANIAFPGMHLKCHWQTSQKLAVSMPKRDAEKERGKSVIDNDLLDLIAD